MYESILETWQSGSAQDVIGVCILAVFGVCFGFVLLVAAFRNWEDFE